MRKSRSELLALRGRTHHLRSWGPDDGPLMVLVHGWGDVAATWQFVVDAFEQDWRIVAPDLRGFGQTEGNNDTYWFAEYVADLDAVLEHVSPNAPVKLVGHSLGGNLVSLYAGVRPERVERLVNLEGTGLPPHPPEMAPKRMADWLAVLRQKDEGKLPWFRKYANHGEFAARLQKDNPRLTDERADFMARHLGEVKDDGMIGLAADVHHRWDSPTLYRVEEYMAIWRNIAAPVLMITGAHSFLFSRFFGKDAPEYRRRVECFRDIKEVMLENSGHNMHHDEPETVARLIEEFMQS
jgi:pimeloyl-ACP methyl ester carboxylesterase